MPAPYSEYEIQRAAMIEELGEVAPEPLRSRLGAIIRPAIVLETSASVGELAPLASKFGGAPDVPVGFEWPHDEGQPLSFVAQLRLKELQAFDLEGRLPTSGLLSFWTNYAVGNCGVFHFQSEDWQKLDLPQREICGGFFQKLRRRFAGKRILTLSPTPLQFDVCPSHPWNCAEFYGEEQTITESEGLMRAFEDLSYSSGHQMFGFPCSVQNDVRDDCAREWNEFLNSSQARKLELSLERDQTTWSDWELLLQIGEDANAKMAWGDAGMIYFLIRRVDLEAHRFDRCWFVSQYG